MSKIYETALATFAKRRERIVKMRQQGKPVPEIADKFGISRMRVYQILQQELHSKTNP